MLGRLDGSVNVPFGDLKLHYESYKTPIDQSVGRVLASGHFILGPELERFERDFEAFLGSSYVAGCASGTEAIYLALAACSVTENDEVIVVAHTAVPTVNAISMTGAKPVFVDIDPSTYVMDVAEVEAKITNKTKAIIPVHLYGQMVDMDPLLKIAAKHGIRIVEDAAQATGATYRGRKAGTIGDFGAFSFYPSKNLGAFGDGGAVSTKSREDFDRVIMLRNYGQSKRYYHDVIGINSRLDELQAAILSCQIPYVEGWNERRREIAHLYTEGLKDFVVTPSEADYVRHVFHLYVIQSSNRDQLQAYLLEQGIQTLIHYPVPVHLQKAYGYLGYKPADLPATEFLAKRILSLPMFPGLTHAQIEKVTAHVRKFHEKRGAILDCSPTDVNSTCTTTKDRMAEPLQQA
jgi:dTDP-4-amino-4,6-dideoxygalactose transaminase